MGSFIEEITCMCENCYSFVIFLLDVIAIAYLVFASYFPKRVFTKILGWFWIAVILIGTVVLMCVHNCLFTLLAAVFSLMMIATMLSTLIPERKKQDKVKAKANGGYYLLRRKGEGFGIELYNSKNALLIQSVAAFSVEKARELIDSFREETADAPVQDKTATRIKLVDKPRFVVERNREIRLSFVGLDDTGYVVSAKITDLSDAMKLIKQIKCFAATTDVYLETDGTDVDIDKPASPPQPPETEETAVSFAATETEEAAVSSAEPEDAAAEDAEPSDTAPAEAVGYAEEERSEEDKEEEILLVTRLDKSFEAKLIQSEQAQIYYGKLKNHLLGYKNVKSRASWDSELFYSGRNQIARFVIRGKTLNVYLSLTDDEANGNRAFVPSDVSKYEKTAYKIKLKSNRSFVTAYDAVDVICARLGIRFFMEGTEKYSLPYRTTETLIKKGLIKKKQIKPFKYKGK
ncbi:MAG: hypothetical protein ACI4MH_00930 [Candidatus Coproplasma sp.]